MKLFSRQYGETGPAIVILHGLFGSGDNWIMIAKELAKSHRVFLLDQRNHGRSPWSDDFSYSVLAQDLLHFIDENKLAPVVAIGHSMGGKTVMNAVLQKETAFESIIIVDIAPRPYKIHHLELIQAMQSLPENLETRSQVDAHLRIGIPEEGTRQFLMKSLEKDELGKFRWRINLPVILKNIEEVGKPLESDETVHVPALFIKGSLSDYIRETDGFEIKKQFVLSRVVTIEGAGHWVQAEKPTEFLETVKEWLS